jgi:xanthine dehydrogenase small subunit
MISRIPVTSARSLEEAYAALASREPGLRVLAGGTDVMVQLNAGVGIERIGRVLDIWRVPELRGIRRDGDTLVLGALTTYTELISSALVRDALPALAEVSREIGAWAIQNRGTLGGNVCNASPAGDTLPILLAADAVFHLGGPRGERAVAAERFFVGYRKTALAGDELLLRVALPLGRGELRYRKVGTRRAQSISKTILAVRARSEGTAFSEVRVAAGCVAEVPLRCRKAEAACEGRPISAGTIAAACSALQDDIRPIDDVRSDAEYRRRVSAAVLGRLLESASR